MKRKKKLKRSPPRIRTSQQPPPRKMTARTKSKRLKRKWSRLSKMSIL